VQASLYSIYSSSVSTSCLIALFSYSISGVKYGVHPRSKADISAHTKTRHYCNARLYIKYMYILYSLNAVFHGDSIAPQISQIGTVQLELCRSAKERRVLKSVTNKYFSISIKCKAECDGVRWLFWVVHSS
jgi:hypothetical protein